MINIPNIDGKIWNIESKTTEIVFEMIHNNPLDLYLDFEGPCADSLKLYQWLDNLCDKFNYSKDKICIHTCNQLETHPHYRIKKYAPLYIDSAQNFWNQYQNTFVEKTFDKDFKHFGIFVGRSNWSRLLLSGYLNNHYSDQTQITFHYDPKSDFHMNHLGLDELVQIYPELLETIQPLSLIKRSPVRIEEVESYPIITPAHFAISKIYHSFFVEIVCETFCQGQTFYPTEKIWRPIIMKTPFIVQGPQNYMQNLHRLGFKTFSQWWDESHSQDVYSYQPLAIMKLIDNLAKLSMPELKEMYHDMKSTLDHNFDVMMKLTKADVLKAFDE